MTEPSAAHWYPTAAYLYTLHLDGPALAWEYLRRHPDYRLDWQRRRRWPQASHRWGCACWRTRHWTHAMRILSGFPTTLPWCSSIPTLIRHPMPMLSRSGASPATST